MHRASLNMLASSNGGRKRKAPESREMTQSPPPPPRFPIPPYQMAGAGVGAPPPLTPQLRLDQPGASSGAPPRFPTPPQQMAPPPQPLHLDQPGASSSMAQPPYFDTVLRLGVTPHVPRTEQGFKEDAPPPANLHLHKDFIDQALKRNNDGVREMLEEMCKRQYAEVVTAAEEKAAKKLKEADEEIVEVRTKNRELEAMLASYRTQAAAMADRLEALKETNAALNAALHEATHRRATPPADGGNGVTEEEAQSSSLDPDQVVVIRISCKICWRGPATMMAWSCRHLCLCNNCARTTNRCPICDATFQDFIEVKFY